MGRPSLFIGSSTKGLKIAKALQENLETDLDVEIWNQGAFALGDFNLESLINAGKKHQFAVLVLTPDDLIILDESALASPRDNVVFEMGFFLGVLGRKQAFIVHENGLVLKLPSDIDGLTRVTYTLNQQGNLTSALSSASTKILKVANGRGPDTFNEKKEKAEKETKVLVERALHTICSALAIPKTPYDARLRAFVFKKEGNSLVCSHFWAPNKVKEVVGELMFGINPETEKQVAVVKAFRQKKVCSSPISVLPENLEGVKGEVEDDLCFVLAAPIMKPDGEVWGIVDFDASNKEGEYILRQHTSEVLLFELGNLLNCLLHQNEHMEVLR
jgi:Predicted nucleotide-binding protein containing TIR-like domain